MKYSLGSKNVYEIDIPNRVYWKLIAFVVSIFLILKLFTLLQLLFVAILIAVSLNPLVKRLQSYKMGRSQAIALVTLMVAGAISWVVFTLIPTIYEQVQVLINDFPQLQERLMSSLSKQSVFKGVFHKNFISEKFTANPGNFIQPVLAVLETTLSGLVALGIVLVFSVYFLIDGKRAKDWIIDFFSAPVRLKLNATSQQIAPVISAYVTAQLISCALCGIFSFALLSLMDVPAALTLATAAAILDVVPLLGFLMTLIPVVAISLTVSLPTAIGVFVAYGMYHIFEVYVLLPIIYHRKLKLPALVILLSVLAAWSLGGLLLTAAILPLIASYSIIEKIWLPKLLGRRVIERHRAQGPDAIDVWSDKILKFQDEFFASASDRHISSTLGRTILIIDDDHDMRALLRDVLETEGYTVLEASQGQEGLEYFETHNNIGLIILDYQMPIMNGKAFMENIQNYKLSRNIPVIVLSAETKDIEIKNGDIILQKPVDLKLFLNTITQLFTSSYSAPAETHPRPIIQQI